MALFLYHSFPLLFHNFVLLCLYTYLSKSILLLLCLIYKPRANLPLSQKIPRSMVNVIIRESRHSKVTVIITVLPPDINLSLSIRGFDEVFGKKLPVVVEIVCCALYHVESDRPFVQQRRR